MGGGVGDGDGSGHALFYEWSLHADGLVTLQVTNSGDGLQFHLQDERTRGHFRTLSFSGTTIQELQQTQFLERLLSFRRPRPQLTELAKVISPLSFKLAKISDVYLALFYNWPGNGVVQAANPGKGQRSSSCTQFILNFLHYDQIMRTGSPSEQQQLRPILYAACVDSDPLITSLGRILWKAAEEKRDFQRLLQEKGDLQLSEASLKSIAYPRRRTPAEISFSSKLDGAAEEPLPPRPAQYEETFRPLFPIAFTQVPEVGEVSEQAIQSKGLAILAKANHLHNHPQLHLEVARDLRAPFDLEILLIILGRGDLSAIRNRNPSLSDEEIEELMQDVFHYAQMLRQSQHPEAPYHTEYRRADALFPDGRKNGQ